jgi:hypothetical protein
MARRLAALALLVALAFAGSVAYGMVGAEPNACRMGRACPMGAVHADGRGERCPVRTTVSVELGCCAPAPAAPSAPSPTVACPYQGGTDVAPALPGAATRCAVPPLRQCDLSRERARAARLHDLGLPALLSTLLI